MNYKYYLFTDSNYGSIGTNNERIYNKKQRKENYKVLNKTFFKVMFLCLALTFIALPFWAIFSVDLILSLAYTFAGLTLLFALLFMVFFYLAERDTFIADFKLTKEYLDQVKEYKLKKAKEYTESLFKVIEKYNELNQQKEEEKVEEKPNEVIVKLDDAVTRKIISGVRLVVKENFNDMVNLLQTMGYYKTEESKPATEELTLTTETTTNKTENTVVNETQNTNKEEKTEEQKNTKTKENTTRKQKETKVEIVKKNTKSKGGK